MATTITVLGQFIDEVALLKGYDLISKSLNNTVIDFYSELFSKYPQVKSLFKNTDEISQSEKLASALKLLLENLHEDTTLIAVLSDMGKRHQQYGALPEHYLIVIELLLTSFKKNIGRSWTKAINAAWKNLLVSAAQTMCAVYNETAEVTVFHSESTKGNEMSSSVNKKLNKSVLTLNNIQDISKSQILKNEMLELFDTVSEADINASEVDRIDGSAMQLLCALFIYAQKNDYKINWINPSDALIFSAKTLGMKKVLKLG